MTILRVHSTRLQIRCHYLNFVPQSLNRAVPSSGNVTLNKSPRVHKYPETKTPPRWQAEQYLEERPCVRRRCVLHEYNVDLLGARFA